MGLIEPGSSMAPRPAPPPQLGNRAIARTVAAALLAQADAARQYADTLAQQAAAIDAAITAAGAPTVLPQADPRRTPVFSRAALAAVEEIVCRFFSIEPADLKSRRNTREAALPRMITYALMVEFSGASIAQIARRYDRHHTTVMYARDEVREREKAGFDRELVFSITTLREKCREALSQQDTAPGANLRIAS
jgi:chromosomal replication initiation ATPase DnaA